MREGDPRNPRTALLAFLFLVVTLLCLVLLHSAVVTTDHGPAWWSAIAG